MRKLLSFRAFCDLCITIIHMQSKSKASRTKCKRASEAEKSTEAAQTLSTTTGMPNSSKREILGKL
jgi:hypothetical protein